MEDTFWEDFIMDLDVKEAAPRPMTDPLHYTYAVYDTAFEKNATIPFAEDAASENEVPTPPILPVTEEVIHVQSVLPVTEEVIVPIAPVPIDVPVATPLSASPVVNMNAEDLRQVVDSIVPIAPVPIEVPAPLPAPLVVNMNAEDLRRALDNILASFPNIPLTRFKKEAIQAWRRKFSDGNEAVPVREFQSFVKDNIKDVQNSNIGGSHTDHMRIIGNMWRETKKRKLAA